MQFPNKLVLLPILLVWITSFQAQEKKSPYKLGLNMGYGFIIPHSPIMEYITNQHFNQREIYFEKRTFGKKAWPQRYHYPRLGFSIRHFQLNNPRHLGQAYSISPYMNFKVLGNKLFQLRLKLSLGLGYLEKPFDTESNYKNVAVSSHLNMFAAIGLQTEYKIHPKWSLLLGATFSHFSNTAFKKPNLGINLPTAEAGISYSFGKEKAVLSQEEEEDFQTSKANWIINLSGGLNERYPPNGKKFFATALQLRREKALNYKSSIGGGVDFFYNPAQIEQLKQDSIYIEHGWENLQIGISAYHLLKFGRMAMITQVGHYLKKEAEEHNSFYHLVGGRITISEKWDAYLAIKTHYTVAEYFLIGTAIKI